jgi:hypothetical protein
MANRGVVLLIVALGAVVQGQSKPDFSGIWAPVPVKADATASTGGVAALPPSDLTIQQSAAALSNSRNRRHSSRPSMPGMS